MRSREAANGAVSPYSPTLAFLGPTMSAEEEAAFLKLGLEKFHHWAVRGWWSLSDRGDNV